MFTTSYPIHISDNLELLECLGGIAACYSQDLKVAYRRSMIPEHYSNANTGIILCHKKLINEMSRKHLNTLITHEEGHLINEADQYPIFKETKSITDHNARMTICLPLEIQADRHAVEKCGRSDVVESLIELYKFNVKRQGIDLNNTQALGRLKEDYWFSRRFNEL